MSFAGQLILAIVLVLFGLAMVAEDVVRGRGGIFKQMLVMLFALVFIAAGVLVAP